LITKGLRVQFEERDKQNLRAALRSWVVNEQIRAGRRVGWVPRAGLL